MKNTAFALLATVLLASGCSEKQPAPAAASAPKEESMVKKGEYLVGILGCHDCHSPKRMGLKGPEIIAELQLSGYPADRPLGKPTSEALRAGWTLFNSDLTAGVGPWGVTFAANITSDDSGIGTWSLEQFTRALTQGKSKGMADGRMLQPPMPWYNYMAMKAEDVEAIFQYLKSTKPVRNVVPAPMPPDQVF